MGKNFVLFFLERTFVRALPLHPVRFYSHFGKLPLPSERTYVLNGPIHSRSIMPLFFKNYWLVKMTYLLLSVSNIKSFLGKTNANSSIVEKTKKKQGKEHKNTHKHIHIQTERQSYH